MGSTVFWAGCDTVWYKCFVPSTTKGLQVISENPRTRCVSGTQEWTQGAEVEFKTYTGFIETIYSTLD